MLALGRKRGALKIEELIKAEGLLFLKGGGRDVWEKYEYLLPEEDRHCWRCIYRMHIPAKNSVNTTDYLAHAGKTMGGDGNRPQAGCVFRTGSIGTAGGKTSYSQLIQRRRANKRERTWWLVTPNSKTDSGLIQ